jgi:hypothetical protein
LLNISTFDVLLIGNIADFGNTRAGRKAPGGLTRW